MATPDFPEDDLSHLPTAGEGPLASPAPSSPGTPRRRTRIGPRQPAPEPEPEAEVEPAPAPDFHAADLEAPAAEGPAQDPSDWQELFESTAATDDSFAYASGAPEFPQQPQPEPEPAPAPARKRTVIGPRKQVEEPVPPHAPEPPPPAADRTPDSDLKPANPKSAAKTPPAPEPGQTAPPAQQPAESAEGGAPASASSGAADSQASDPDGQTPTSAEAPAPAASGPPTALRRKWEQWGGQALSVSVLVHAALILLAATAVYTQIRPQQVDFLPGGTRQGAAASQALEHHIQTKRSPWLKKAMPSQKLVSTSATASIVLPDEMPQLADFSSTDISSSRVGSGLGLGGAGGGFGRSMGLGSQSGMVFQPFSMFGMQIRAKRMAVVLDVSQSMAPHLPRVVAEVDKVAKGSIVILFVGCGMQQPPPRGLDGEEEYSTSSAEFEKFWRMGGATVEEARKFRFDRKDPIPSEEIYRLLSKRPQTYFIHNVGVSYAWLALLSDRLSTADGIYWFSDFQDNVEYRQLEIVRSNLLRRKQRLYMHAYMRGSFYDLLNSQLVKLTGGDTLVEGE